MVDPERQNTYSRISQLIATYDSYLIKEEPKSSQELITNIYPWRIDLRIIPMCSHGSITRWTEEGPSSYGWLCCDFDYRYIYSSLNYTSVIRLMSVNRINGNELSSRSLANQCLESSPNSLTMHSSRQGTLSNYPGLGSQTIIDSPGYFSDTS